MNAARRFPNAVLGPGGWRSVVGPLAFVLAGIALLVYDHLNHAVPPLVFWLTLGLILAVFARMLETNRRQSRALVRQEREAVNDKVTGLRNRASLEGDIAAAVAAPGHAWVLLLLELDGLESHNDRFGYAAGDEVLRDSGLGLAEAVLPLGGIAYRVAAAKFAVLVPAGDRQLGEIVLAATSSPQVGEAEAQIGRSYGEVAIPEEAGDAETAFRVASGRLAAHRRRRQRSARRQAHAVLMAALDARHPELRGHLRVTAYRAIALARRLRIDREQIDDISLAAELQRIGLLAVSDQVLEKERLDESEYAVVRSHTAEGARIVAAAPELADVARLVRSSGEHFDGSGYPDGLGGDSIPLGARVIAVAVAFAALTERRPGREPVGPEEALAELRRHAGSQFDPRIVEALALDLAEEAGSTPASTPA